MFLSSKEGLPSAPSYDEVMAFRDHLDPMADVENHPILLFDIFSMLC